MILTPPSLVQGFLIGQFCKTLIRFDILADIDGGRSAFTLSAQLKQWDQSKQDSINQLREQMNDTLENLASEQGNAANDAASSLADNRSAFDRCLSGQSVYPSFHWNS